MKFGSDVRGTLRIKPDDFGEPLSLPLLPL